MAQLLPEGVEDNVEHRISLREKSKSNIAGSNPATTVSCAQVVSSRPKTDSINCPNGGTMTVSLWYIYYIVFVIMKQRAYSYIKFM